MRDKAVLGRLSIRKELPFGAISYCRQLMKKPYLEIGKVVGTHGVRGEVKIQPWCDSAEFLCGFSVLYLDANGGQSLRAVKLRPHKNVVLGVFETVDTVEKAEALRGKILYMSRADAPLKEGNFFVQDLLGCKVVDIDTSVEYGILSDVIAGAGANDIWAVKDAAGKETLIPAVPSIVIETDVDSGFIRIRPISGLFDGKESVIRNAD